MPTLLAVDDEPRQVRALAAIIRQLKPHYHIMQAIDGESAWDILCSEPVDIVITDVRMPGMDGITLTSLISKMDAPPKVVLLTGYEEFEYAVQALRHRAFDYLLKPIGKPELAGLLDRLETALQEEVTAKQQMESIQQLLTTSLPVYEETMLNRWIQGEEVDPNWVGCLEPFFVPDRPGMIVVTEVSAASAVSALSKPAASETDDWFSTLRNGMHRRLRDIADLLVFRSDNVPDQAVAVLAPPPGSPKWPMRQLEQCLNELLEQVREETGLCASVCIGPEVDELSHKGRHSYLQALEGLQHIFYAGVGQVLSATAPLSPFAASFPFREEFARFTEEWPKQDRFLVTRFVNDHMEKLKLHHCDPALVKEEWYVYLMQLAKKVRCPFTEEQSRSWQSETKRQLFQCGDYQEFRKVLIRFLMSVMDQEEQLSKHQHKAIVDQCIRYLETHYKEELSLEELSQRYHFHPSYFSSIFKSVAGIGFSEYVQKVRIDQAKRLILQTDDKMADIAIKVGFKDAAYFNKIFKKETGHSPYKYKRIQAQL